MQEMTKTNAGLVKRGNKWIVRKRVPDELQSIIGKREITRSLATSDLSEAKKDYHHVMVDIEQQFSNARQSLSNSKKTELSIIQADSLAKRWYEDTYANITDESYALVDQADKEFVKDDLDYFQSLYIDGEENDLQQNLQSTADRLLIKNGFPCSISDDDFADETLIGIDKNSKGYQRLLNLIRRGHINALKKQRAILENRASSDPFFSSSTQYQKQFYSPENEVDLITLDELISKYLLAKDYDLTDRNYKDLQATFRIMMEIIGSDKFANQISYDDLQTVLSTLKRLPPNFRKPKYRSKMTLNQVADDAKKRNEQPYSPTMINKHMARIKALMKWGNGTGIVNKDYFVSGTLFMKRPKNLSAKDARDPFTVEELNILFNQDIFTKPNVNKPSFYWATLIALFHGLRMEEILQLKFDDIQREGDVSFFKIHDDGDNSLKNANSKRSVPIHDLMWTQGFKYVVENANLRSDGRLFPDVIKGKRDKHSAIFSQRYSRYLDKIGIKRKKLSFHSFRHNFRDVAKNCNLRSDRIDEIGGWAYETGAKARYGSGINLVELNNELQRIEYSGVNINSITVFSE